MKVIKLLACVAGGLLVTIAFFLRTPVWAATCDLCGYCQGAAASSDWEKCRHCLYPSANPSPEAGETLVGNPTTFPGKEWTVFGCISTSPGGFVQTFLGFAIAISGGAAFLSLLYGAGLILISSGNPQNINRGKEIILYSVLGLVLVLFSVFLLRVIGVDILQLPGFSSS